MQNQTIAILGGTGFLGSALASDLCKQGYEVRIASRHPQRHQALQVMPLLELVKTNPYSDSSLRRLLAGCDAAINLIGILNESGRDGKGFAKVHTELPPRIAAACIATGVNRLLHVSALRANANDAPSHYLKSKGEGENRLRRVASDGRLPLTIFQPSVIFGREDSFTNRFAGLLRLPVPFLPLPRPNARFAPVYVKDVTAAILKALGDPETAGKTFQLCGPKVHSLRELVELIGDSIGADKRIVGMPDGVARLQAFFMDFVPGKPFSTDNFRSLQINSICENDGFAKLGIQPRSPDTLIPKLLGPHGPNDRYRRYRERAGR